MADDMTREEMLGTLHGTRHERCIPSHAVTNPVPMPSTSNYQRDMAIGVDKSEFLKIVMRKAQPRSKARQAAVRTKSCLRELQRFFLKLQCTQETEARHEVAIV